MLFQYILLFGFVISVCSHWNCPDDWFQFKGSCYLYDVNRYPVNWDLAQGACYNEGAQLVEIESTAEQTFLVDLIQNWPLVRKFPVWIGLHERENKGTHIWYSTGKPANYTNWGTDEPNDNKGKVCVQVTNTGLWNDVRCGSARHYVCERPVKAKCPLGWAFFRGSCYSFEDTKYTTKDAEIACKADGSHLVEITSAAENSFVVNLIKSQKVLSLSAYAAYDDAAWIGLGDMETIGTHVWYYFGKVANYANWGANEPTEVIGQACVSIDFFGKWNNTRCSINLDYICERPANEPCDDGWSFLNRRCYKHFNKTASWESAKIACNEEGAALVDITSAAENEFLVNLREVFTDGSPSNAWIGLNVVNDTYIWDSSGSTTSYKNWAIGQPDNDQSSKMCVEMYVYGKWNDNSCTKYRTYFCEKSSITNEVLDTTKPDVVIGTETWLDSTISSCEYFLSDNYSVFRSDRAVNHKNQSYGGFFVVVSNDFTSGECVELKTDFEIVWIECRAGCAALVNITTAAENALLVNLRQISTGDGIPSDAWIGLNAVDNPDIFDPSGNTTRYTNWANGEPNNVQHSENCFEVYEDGKWNDNSCTKYRTYFCEKSSIFIPQSLINTE